MSPALDDLPPRRRLLTELTGHRFPAASFFPATDMRSATASSEEEAARVSRPVSAHRYALRARLVADANELLTSVRSLVRDDELGALPESLARVDRYFQSISRNLEALNAEADNAARMHVAAIRDAERSADATHANEAEEADGVDMRRPADMISQFGFADPNTAEG